MQSHVGDISVAREIDGESVRDVEHVAAPRVLCFACFRIQSTDGHVRDGRAIHQLEVLVESAAKFRTRT